ncbi:MAG TPA: hypothetical protein VMA35_07430 [Candidatus Sulfopaludibacter sp.]|nr:hypothetical protein [Candidatus Sulfopaludibacter sp.]
MLITNKKRFIQVPFDSEEEIETVVVENATDIFGASALYFPKALIKTSDGAGTIPDGFAIDLAEKRWFIVEAETSKHNVWGHIAPQVAKQVVASIQTSTKKILVDLAVKRAQQNPEVGEMFAEANIHQMDIRKVLDDIMSQKPIIGMPIDAVSKDLEEWANTLNVKVRLWLLKKYIEFGNPKSVLYEIPDDARPILSTIEDESDAKTAIAQYDISIRDLIVAGLITPGDKLTMTYGPRKGEKKVYEGAVGEDGSITVLGKTFPSSSYAGVYVIQSAGSSRKTVNGWTSWRNSDGLFLADLRDEFLKRQR